MPRTIHRLSVLQIEKKNLKAGVHGDGNSLFLRVSKTGARSWVLIYTFRGVRRETGAGSYPAVSLADARLVARKAREQIAAGKDPLVEKRRENPPLLSEMLDRFIEEFGPTVVPKLAKRWRSLVTIHAAPLCGLHVDAITTASVAAILKKTFSTNPASAKHLRGILERIFNYCIGHGFMQTNPATWTANLEAVMKKMVTVTVNQPSMPYEECPDFFQDLQKDDTSTKAALRFLMLTAVRTRECTGLRWSELDTVGRTWLIPKTRTKNKRAFKVPLSDAALAIIEQQRIALGSVPEPDDLVFRGRFKGRQMSPHTLLRFLADETDDKFTVHGMRSSFRSWAAEHTDEQFETLEMCLNHTVGDSSSQAYARSDLLEKRRAVMSKWSDFLTTKNNS